MFQLIVYSLLIFLTLLAICDVIGYCARNGEPRKRYIPWAAPYHMVKNKLKGRRTLKEEDAPADKPTTISETV